MKQEKEICYICDREFDEKDMFWASLPVDDGQDEDNFYACENCTIKHKLETDPFNPFVKVK
jgi:hypothetical protein